MKTLRYKLKEGLEKRIYNEDKFIDEILNFQKDIILNRLKEQYKTTQKLVLNYNRNLQDYNAMRLFCLDTQLISFNDIELMEYEIDSSF